jgi:hypothetical protein
MTIRYKIFETLIICYQVGRQIGHKRYLFSPWAQVKPKFDFKITYQVNTNFPVGFPCLELLERPKKAVRATAQIRERVFFQTSCL